MNIQRTIINEKSLKHFNKPNHRKINYEIISKELINKINSSKHPVLFLGNGINKDNITIRELRNMINKIKIPVLYSMLGKNYIEEESPYNFGFMGSAYGQRYANIIGCKKTDLIISFGCRLNGRTIGLKKSDFNPGAQIIRIEIDDEELKLKVHENDINYNIDVNMLIYEMNKCLNRKIVEDKSDWLSTCSVIKNKLYGIDDNIESWLPNRFVKKINKYMTNDGLIFADVGQNLVWAAHSIKIKNNQKIIFSGGLGAMGFSLPASIGGCIANNKVRTFVIVGDGGMQMNIQELQLLKNEQLPITIFVFNNESLGLIHQQQTDFFDNKYYGSSKQGGYTSPSFKKIAKAYGINSCSVRSLNEFDRVLKKCDFSVPNLIEIKLPVGTKAYPKTFFGNDMINQRPELSDELLNTLLNR